MLTKEELKQKEDDSNLQFIVLLQIIIEKIEFLESQGYIFGNIKAFLKNGKTRFEEHLRNIFKKQSSRGELEAADALYALNKITVMQERVELALLNQYLLTVDERKERAKEVLSKYLIAPMVDKALVEMEEQNLFNF